MARRDHGTHGAGDGGRTLRRRRARPPGTA